jgi:uncharacterized protein
MQRRTFLSGLAAGAAVSVQGSPQAATGGAGIGESLPRTASPGELRGEMLYRKLGSTGEMVSAIGMGGSHISKATITQQEATKMIHEAVDRGLTFLDNSWDYNEGRGEMYVGNALAEEGYRKKAFVMTKVDGRTKEVAARQIEDSLTRLKTDHIDLLQHHEVLRFDDPDRIFAEGGAMEAFLEAKKAGKIRHVGFTGHKDPHVHLYMLDVAAKHGFTFETVQMPLNVMDAHFRSFAQAVVPKLVEAGIGVLGMKPFGGGDGIILKSNTVQPLDCLHYALTLPTSVVITGIDKPEVLQQAFAAVKDFKPLSVEEVSALLSKTQEMAMTGHFELFKTTAHFDTTARHADWLGADTPSVQKLAPQLPG